MQDASRKPTIRRSRFWRDNGLTIVLLSIFAATLLGQLFTGWAAENEELRRHGAAPIGLAAYSISGAFVSAVFENWESEFLQMAAYVILTAMLFQRGSAESRDPDEEEAAEAERERPRPDSPWPTRSGGLVVWLYERSLGLALLVLFVLCFVLHWWGSWRAATTDAVLHGAEVPTALAHLADPDFWFESFQNWQSEFLSTAVLVVLSIYLRQKGSPESKPVHAANDETGA